MKFKLKANRQQAEYVIMGCNASEHACSFRCRPNKTCCRFWTELFCCLKTKTPQSGMKAGPSWARNLNCKLTASKPKWSHVWFIFFNSVFTNFLSTLQSVNGVFRMLGYFYNRNAQDSFQPLGRCYRLGLISLLDYEQSLVLLFYFETSWIEMKRNGRAKTDAPSANWE